MQHSSLRVVYKSAPNIALVKYWGKYHEDEILPINDNIGITLNTDDLCTTTTVTFSTNIQENRFILNGKQQKINQRLQKVLNKIIIKARASPRFAQMSEQQWNKHHFQITSNNSFPTASGVASSASGLSCLATALNGLFGNILDQRQLSRLARWGSGSASRAVYGGLVKWQGVDQQYLKRKQQISQDQLQKLSLKCISYSNRSASELSFLKVLILLTDNKQKQVSSTHGMQLSVLTSPLIHLRNSIAKQRIAQIQQLLQKIKQARTSNKKEQEYKLVAKFAQVIMRDSNQFHAICLDTYPPIFYLNQFSRQIISMTDNIINKQSKHTKIAYSFDAGAHAFIFLHQDMLEDIVAYFQTQFQLKSQAYNPKGRLILQNIDKQQKKTYFSNYQGKIIAPQHLWVTDVGRGAQQVIQK